MEKNNFDFLRFYFALVVVISHCISLSGAPVLQFLNPYFDTHLSITGFFIISGYLIYGSYLKSNSLKDYCIKRAKRILPAYLFIIFFSAFFFCLFSTYSINEYFFNVQFKKYIFANLFFLNFIEPCLPGVFKSNSLCAINGALWTLKVEVAFYLAIPLIVYFGNKFSKPYLWYILLYVLGLFYQFLLNKLGDVFPEKYSFFMIMKHQMPGFLTYFISGIAINHYFDFYKKNKKYLTIFSVIMFGVEYYFDLEILRPIAFSILIMGIAYGFKFLNNFGKNGDFSYGIYIYHFPLIQFLVSFNWFTIYNPILVIFFIVSVVFAFSYFSWHLLEKKFLYRFKQKRLN
jgi:peptidoglycan/LPS O-acetylase OafA/YrhL